MKVFTLSQRARDNLELCCNDVGVTISARCDGVGDTQELIGQLRPHRIYCAFVVLYSIHTVTMYFGYILCVYGVLLTSIAASVFNGNFLVTPTAANYVRISPRSVYWIRLGS